MDWFPVFHRFSDQKILIVGGGDIALRKARLIQRAGAVVHLVAPTIDQKLQALVEKNNGQCLARRFEPADLDGVVLAIAATEDLALNTQVSELAQARNILVNVVDSPALCNFILPSIVDRSPLVVAISSGGSSPVLARYVRSLIETAIPMAFGRFAALIGKFRPAVKQKLPDIDQRRDFWEGVIESPVGELMLAGKETQAEQRLAEMIEDSAALSRAEVYLVGAGPGDPDLLTFKALRLMQKADVVLYDRLVADEIVALTRADAERVYVGKARSDHAVPQNQINQLLVDYAKQNKRVLRLKGGDPFIFGRGGEELALLAEENIPFQVVPGVTAASGCAAYAGIPLTHRDYAQSVRFVTGHLKDGSLDLPWHELVHPAQTVVFYMGLMGLPTICAKLIENGRSEYTPIALIQQGTTKHQKVITATLATMVERIEDEAIQAPTLIIVGEVVELRDSLSWYDS